jgi:excinuclease UvrABC nuclease subunit
MRGDGELVLYVGKAKNLRQRLASYRVANPDRMPRRHFRLLRAVVSIEVQECADEHSALAREAELLRTLKPRFNSSTMHQPATYPVPPLTRTVSAIGLLSIAISQHVGPSATNLR